MCGLIGGAVPAERVTAALSSIAHRGPDGQGVWTDGTVSLGHARLSVQDVTGDGSAQPYVRGGTAVTYNGEMWTPHLLPGQEEDPLNGDTPAVARLLEERGADALPDLRGMFALAWASGGSLYLARDEYGEVPLHYGADRWGALLWASEVKGLLALGAVPGSVRWVPPGHVITRHPSGRLTSRRYAPVAPPPSEAEAAGDLARCLSDAVRSRMTADVPVAVLLSGGLDSAVTLGALRAGGYETEAYVAVHDPRAADLKHARRVARHYGVTLNEVRVPDPTAESLSAAVRVAEMPHKAQVEITLGCLPLAEALRSDGVRVVLSGEGSDELWASYGMAYHGIKEKGWHRYRRDLFSGQHRKNFARVNKVFMSRGVEARMPFLDPPLVRHALSLSQEEVTQAGRHPKAVLAAAAAEAFGVPPETAWRSKRAFQIDARLDRAAAQVHANPGRVYQQEFKTEFRGVKA